MKDLHEIASTEALQVRETIEGGNNGYPRGFENVITGFFDWKQIEDFVKEYGGTPIMLHKRDGWQMWERCDKVYEPMEITAEMYGDDYDILTPNMYANEQDFIFDYVCSKVENCDTFEELEGFVADAHEIWGELKDCNEYEGVLTYYQKYRDTVLLEAIKWSHDAHNYMIGVIFDDEED